jgi:hypothetical protein
VRRSSLGVIVDLGVEIWLTHVSTIIDVGLRPRVIMVMDLGRRVVED